MARSSRSSRRPEPGDGDDKPKIAFHVSRLDAAQAERLGAWCEARGWERFDVAHAAWAYRGPRVNAVAYASGKLVVSGKGTEEFVIDVLEPEILREARLGYDAVHHPDWFEPHAGMDESGKGDFFGPLVSACVVADGAAVEAWLKDGVKDSKKLGDRTIEDLEEKIRATPGVVVEVTTIGMERYNELMARPRANLNRLLAWMHARSLKAALGRRAVPWGLLDQFSTERLVDGYLPKELLAGFDLRMRTRAEEDPVVAAASIVARAEFVRRMGALGRAAGRALPKGASAQVREVARAIVEERGAPALRAFAKLHFRTAYEVVEAAGQLDRLPLRPPGARMDPSVYRKRARPAAGNDGPPAGS